MSQLAHHQDHDDLDVAVDEAVARAGGDLRLAVRTLARRQHELENVIALYIVQQFEKRGKKLVAGRVIQFMMPDEAIRRGKRDADRFPGVFVVQQEIDTDTGKVLEESFYLAKHGELPQQFREE